MKLNNVTKRDINFYILIYIKRGLEYFWGDAKDTQRYEMSGKGVYLIKPLHKGKYVV